MVEPPLSNPGPPLPPHPYQAAGLYDYRLPTPVATRSSFAHSHPSRSTGRTVISSGGGSDNRPAITQNTYIIQHQHHHYHHHSPQIPPSHVQPQPGPDAQDKSIIYKLRLFIILLVFLPIPPFLSLIYLLIGHAILHRAFPSSMPWSVRLLSSANAGAIGGIILAPPLFLLLFIMLYPTNKSSPTREAHEDFFEDDESHTGSSLGASKLAVYATCVILILTVGGAAGPLGVTCLSNNNGAGSLLPVGYAAAAGLMGGVIFWAVIVLLSVSGFLGKFLWARTPPQKVDR